MARPWAKHLFRPVDQSFTHREASAFLFKHLETKGVQITPEAKRDLSQAGQTGPLEFELHAQFDSAGKYFETLDLIRESDAGQSSYSLPAFTTSGYFPIGIRVDSSDQARKLLLLLDLLSDTDTNARLTDLELRTGYR